jgi:hypothetical protein
VRAGYIAGFSGDGVRENARAIAESAGLASSGGERECVTAGDDVVHVLEKRITGLRRFGDFAPRAFSQQLEDGFWRARDDFEFFEHANGV